MMVKSLYCMVPLFLVVTWSIALGDNRTDETGKPVSLEQAVIDFNEDSDVDREKLGLTRLTAEEVSAAIRGTTGMSAEDYELFKEIADSKELPANAKLVLYRRHFANGYKSSVWRIVLYIKKKEKDDAKIEVRNQYISTEKHKPFPDPVRLSK